jgi:hypothetical protein
VDLVVENTVFAGSLQNMSDGGLSILVDAGDLDRGMAAKLCFRDGLTLSAWVCHVTPGVEGLRIGLSFSPVGTHEDAVSRPVVSVPVRSAQPRSESKAADTKTLARVRRSAYPVRPSESGNGVEW